MPVKVLVIVSKKSKKFINQHITEHKTIHYNTSGIKVKT